MGQTLPTIAVKRFTAIEQEQIKQTYSVLCQRSGTNKINQPTFVQYWTDYVDPIIADRLWLIFDTKYDSFLDFEEWATGLSNTLRGNKDDRIKLLANIFDIDNHGYVMEHTVRKLFATNLFAARNIVKPFDWEAYDNAKKQQDAQAELEHVKALYEFAGTNDMELSFQEGAVMQLLSKVDDEWWWCDLDDRQGYVPANYVEVMKTPVKSGKVSKFQTIKRGMEVDVLMYSLTKLSNQGLGGKIPRDLFVQWALEHEMDLCFNVLEKFDLRVNKPTDKPVVSEKPAPAPPTAASTPAAAPQPTPSHTTQPAIQVTHEPEMVNGIVVPETAMRSDTGESAARISPELATILRAAGIADKELDDVAMSEFINYFIDKHAPRMASGDASTASAGRRRPKGAKNDDSIHRRPLPVPAPTSEAPAPVPPAPPAPAPPTVTVTNADSPSDSVTAPSNAATSLQDQIKSGRKLKPAQKKTNLATLSKKDLTGLGLLLRVQIDSRRNLMQMSDGESSSDGEFE